MDSKYFMLGTLLLSVFVAGSHFNSSLNERAEMRKQIAELQTRHQELLAQVQKDKAEYEAKGQKFKQDVESSEQRLTKLAQEKSKIATALAGSHKRVEEHKQEIEFDLSRLNKYIDSHPMNLDTASRTIQ